MPVARASDSASDAPSECVRLDQKRISSPAKSPKGHAEPAPHSADVEGHVDDASAVRVHTPGCLVGLFWALRLRAHAIGRVHRSFHTFRWLDGSDGPKRSCAWVG